MASLVSNLPEQEGSSLFPRISFYLWSKRLIYGSLLLAGLILCAQLAATSFYHWQMAVALWTRMFGFEFICSYLTAYAYRRQTLATALLHMISLTVSDLLCVDFHFTQGQLATSVGRLLDDDVPTRRSAWIALEVVLCSINCWPWILPTKSITSPLWRGSCVYHSDDKVVEAIDYTETVGCNRYWISYNFPNLGIKLLKTVVLKSFKTLGTIL